MRRLQEQAWDDHDADDEREQAVLALSLPDAHAAHVAHAAQKDVKPSNVTVRYQSQRSQYLRVILDAEKEIARLEGLYESVLDIEGAVGFVVVKRAADHIRDLPDGARRQIATSATHSGTQDAAAEPAGGEV
jgi:hypothetical protein